MITKTLRNAVAGTAAAAALIAPGAMTVAPQIANMACQYPNSVVTQTTATGDRVVEQGDPVKISVNVTSEAGTPNGEVRTKIVGPDRKDKGDKPDVYYNSGFVPLPNDGQKGFISRDNMPPGIYTSKSKFNGNCKFASSSDRFRFQVEKSRGF